MTPHRHSRPHECMPMECRSEPTPCRGRNVIKGDPEACRRWDMICADPAFSPSWFGMSASKSAHFSSAGAKVMHARSDFAIALAAAWAATIIWSSVPMARAWAQDVGFGLGDPYRYYADPGNGGGSAYAPFFDPYRGNRIVRGAYPDAYYDGQGYHYGKSTPPSLEVDRRSYDPQSRLSSDSQDHGDRYRLREGETMTTRIVDPTRQPAGTIVVETARRPLPRRAQGLRPPIRHRHRSLRHRLAQDR